MNEQQIRLGMQRGAIFGIIVAAFFALSLWQIHIAFGYGGRNLIVNPATPTVSTPSSGSSSLEEAVIINDGAETTASRAVTLTLPETTADQMVISNSADFASVSWEPKRLQLQWTLTDGDGLKTVYVRYRNSNSGAVTDTLTGKVVLLTTAGQDGDYSGTSQEESGSVNSDNSTSACSLEAGGAYRATGSRGVYYMTSRNTKSAFRSAPVYFSYFESWNDVKSTTQACLDGVANDSLGFMPWGPLRNLVNGDIVRSPDDPRVYVMVNNKLHRIASEEVFLALYGSWSVVEDVDARLISAYELGSEIANADMHPDGTLVKTADDPKVYMIEGGLYRWIETEEIFNRLGYRWDRIFTVSAIPSDKLGDPIQ